MSMIRICRSINVSRVSKIAVTWPRSLATHTCCAYFLVAAKFTSPVSTAEESVAAIRKHLTISCFKTRRSPKPSSKITKTLKN